MGNCPHILKNTSGVSTLQIKLTLNTDNKMF